MIKSLWEFNPSGITEVRRKRSLVAFLTHTPGMVTNTIIMECLYSAYGCKGEWGVSQNRT